MSVVKGSTRVPLSWSYTLSSGSLIFTTFSLRLNDGSFDDIGTTSVIFKRHDYRTRFDISGSEVATLIIKNVTEREQAVYQCKLTTDSNTWSYRIRVFVTGEHCNVHRSFSCDVIKFQNLELKSHEIFLASSGLSSIVCLVWKAAQFKGQGRVVQSLIKLTKG